VNWSVRAAIVGVIVVVVAGGYLVYGNPNFHASPQTSTCSGFPPGGNCITTYSYAFIVSVNYTGPWKLAYQGYNSLGKSNPTDARGNYSGAGFNSTTIVLGGLDNNGLTLCAQAQKLDNSTVPLILTITGRNETTLPFGSTSYCGGVAP
jgi:hypothetical protein